MEPKETHQLVSVLRCLYVVASALCSISNVHIKAHSGDPWNELVDSLAKLAIKDARRPCSLRSLLRSSVVPMRVWASPHSPSPMWLFLADLPDSIKPMHPPYDIDSGRIGVAMSDSYSAEASGVLRMIAFAVSVIFRFVG